jgi:hypothetical protein
MTTRALTQSDVTGFHAVYWTITATAIASLFISAVIKKFSMDKGLQSNFKLKGGRTPNAPLMAASSSSSENYLPPTNKSSHFNNHANSFGPESTYSTANNSQYSQTGWQAPYDMAHDHTAEQEAQDSAVAYYIQPGGRIISVNIQPDNRPISRDRSTSDFERQHFSATAANGEGHTYNPGYEALLHGERSGSQSGYYPGEYEAGITGMPRAYTPPR